MKIKSKEVLKTLAGKDIQDAEQKPFTVGHALSEILLTTKVGGKMKMFVLAQKFFSDESVEVDEADLALVKSSVEGSDVYNNLINGQLLMILSKEGTKNK